MTPLPMEIEEFREGNPVLKEKLSSLVDKEWLETLNYTKLKKAKICLLLP